MQNLLWKGIFFFIVAVVEGSFFAAQGRLTKSLEPQKVVLEAIWSRGSRLQPRSELVTGKESYVPSGLSAEEYVNIKKEEADRLKKMNFGAWGPRFQRSDVPVGDWMVMPSLWTNGFNAQPKGASLSTNEGSRKSLALAAMSLRKMLPALLLSFLFIDTLTTAFAMARTANLTCRQAVLTVLKVPSLKALSVHLSSMLKIGFLKLAAAGLVAPAMDNVLEQLNRKRLWGYRRTIGVCAGVSLGSLALWTLILRLTATPVG